MRLPERPAETPAILYEDPHLVVLAKPAGLLSQGERRGEPNVVDWLRSRWGRPYVGLLHRLDRNTSGIMIVAKRTKAARRLTRDLQEGRIVRSYLAWTQGVLEGPVKWRHWLLKDPETNTVRVVPAGTRSAREATLSARPVGRGAVRGQAITLLEVVLETGRSHQIRAQCAHEGHPLVGDRKYGGPPLISRPALHSHRIAFDHPMTHERLEFEAPIPDDLARLGVRPGPRAHPFQLSRSIQPFR